MGSKTHIIRGARFAAALSLVLSAQRAGADITEKDRAIARALMDEGRARHSANDLRGALDSFREADALMHFPTTGLEVARVQVELGMLVEAAATLKNVLTSPAHANDPPPFHKAREKAQVLAGELEARVPTIRIVVDVAATITLDGVMEAPGESGQLHRVNPGHHLVVAKVAWGETKEDVEVQEKDAREVVITLPPRPETPPAIAIVPVPVAMPRRPIAPARNPSAFPLDRRHVIVISGAATVLVGIGLGTFAGLRSSALTNDVRGECVDDRCPPSSHDSISEAHHYANIADISFAAAIAGGATAGVFWFMHPKSDASSTSTASLDPWIGVGRVGVRGSF